MSRSISFGLIACALLGAEAFVSPKAPAKNNCGASRLEMSSGVVSQEAADPMTSKEVASVTSTSIRRRGPDMSVAIPFLERPPVLTGELAGDVGFDPLRLAKSEEVLWEYREAEIKHARLAMLAVAGWPMSELLDRSIAEYFNVPATLDAADRVPSVLNGGIGKISPVWWGFCLGLSASIDIYGIARARSAGPDSDYIPGDLGFDPLGLYPKDEAGRTQMQLAEIKHGRAAMLGVTGFAVQEAVTKVGVIDETSFFFQPISETASKVLQQFA